MKGEVGEGVLGKDHPELMRWDVGPSLQFRGHQHGAKARGEIRQGHPERCDAAGLRDRGVILHALRLVVKVTGCKTRLRTDGHDSLPPPPNGEALSGGAPAPSAGVAA